MQSISWSSRCLPTIPGPRLILAHNPYSITSLVCLLPLLIASVNSLDYGNLLPLHLFSFVFTILHALSPTWSPENMPVMPEQEMIGMSGEEGECRHMRGTSGDGEEAGDQSAEIYMI